MSIKQQLKGEKEYAKQKEYKVSSPECEFIRR